VTDDWDFYLCKVEDRPASIFVDIGASKSAPDKAFGHALGHIGSLMLKMQAPRPDGLSSQEEFDTLVALEDGLAKALVDATTVYIGRVTSDGHREFFFYTNAPAVWAERVRTAMQAYPAYRFESDTYEDLQWRTYFEFLYPNAQQMQGIQNRRVCMSLEKHGDRMVNLREVDHFIYFQNARDRGGFLNAVNALGFKVRILMEPDEELKTFGVQLYRIDVPSYENIDEITMPLFDLANEYNGDYDGWETQVVAEKH
jgi:uncharacterized protein (TIGR01619 family)